MPNLDLQKKYIEFIQNTVTAYIANAEIYVYGSRTQQKALEYSDVDIALKCPEIIPIDKILKIKTAFSNSTFPYKVDIIDLNNVKSEFYNIIKNDLYRIN